MMKKQASCFGICKEGTVIVNKTILTLLFALLSFSPASADLPGLSEQMAGITHLMVI
jgi:hypothetical protein